MTEPCVFRHFVSLVDPALPQSGAGWANGRLVAEGYQSHVLFGVMAAHLLSHRQPPAHSAGCL